MRESRLYREDWIGLKALDDKHKLLEVEVEGHHFTAQTVTGIPHISEEEFNKKLLPFFRN